MNKVVFLFVKPLLAVLIFITSTYVLGDNKPTWGAIKVHPSSWIKKPPPVDISVKVPEIVEIDVIQVSFTRRYLATTSLLEKDVIPLEDNAARALIGSLYTPQENKKPYLVRAVMTHYDGNIYGTWTPENRALEIIYNSLGLPGTLFEFSPVIVFLESEPEVVYVSFSSAR